MMHVGTIGSERGLLSNTGRGATPHASRTPARQLELSTPIALESPVLGLLREVHAKYLAAREGAVASYIPELERVAPDQFGIALATVDGHLYEVGDSGSPFTIQSISKPLVYGLALQDRGREAVLARIGVEPSGDAFNAILFDERTNRPFNSMVNTGAIAATSLVCGKNTEERLGRIFDFLRALSGRPVAIDEGVYHSERAMRAPQPGHCLSRTQQRHDQGGCRRSPRSVFPPMLGSDDGDRSRLHRRHFGERRRASGQR
jgi:hypothetical protein